jgi:DNA helicase-2/ATP-dependent DNA helicase PcrA
LKSATGQPPALGLGRVQAIEGSKAQIDFGDQVMWIVLRHAPIEKI